jgi:histidinol-phosphate aminotransferase
MTLPRYRWQPTTEEIAERYGLMTADVVRFDHNTSPFETDWAPGIVGPLARHLNEYPAASYARLRTAAAAYLGSTPDRIVPGAGVDEIILLVAKAFLGPSRRACAVVPTYPMYEIATRQAGAEFIAITQEPPTFAFPDAAFGVAIETSDVTWLCTPNNPTGIRVPDATVARILDDASGLVVIDAAYAEFCGDRWAPWVERYDNLVVCTTMSKGFGLAALRVGFAMTSPEVASMLDGVRPPGSISSLSAEIAEVALSTPSRMERHVAAIHRERARLAAALSDLGFPVVGGDAANFVLCDVGEGADGLAAGLMAEGLVVRTFAPGGPLSSHLRFTVRTPDDDTRLIDALRRLTV